MEVKTYNLWENTPGLCEETPTITHYKPDNQTSDGAVVILPGGGYRIRAPHEGKGYAEFFAANGINAFVVEYRVYPHTFPLPLLDARRGVRYVRHFADKFGIKKDKVAIMGSSAGGHLAAITSTYKEKIEFENIDEIDTECFLPNKQILCYPVINLYDKNIAHIGSGDLLIGVPYEESNDSITRKKLSPDCLVSETTPEAFIWHTFQDKSVNIKNSLGYVSAMKDYNIPAELHVFPNGSHGLGLATGDNKFEKHISQWSGLLLNWLKYMGW